MNTKHFYLLGFIALCFATAIYEGLLCWYDKDATESLLTATSLVSLLALVLWVDSDSKEHSKEIYRPHEFGFLVYLFWLPYLPYYFWRTRGVMGLVKLTGLVSFLFLGYFVQWLIYTVR
jgi:hypothetical protein